MDWFTIIGIGLWIACAVGCANIADRKNRSGGLWFLLGLWAPPIALLVIAFLVKKKIVDGDGDSTERFSVPVVDEQEERRRRIYRRARQTEPTEMQKYYAERNAKYAGQSSEYGDDFDNSDW